MIDFSIIFPKITSKNFRAFANGNNNQEITGSSRDLAKITEGNHITSLQYGTAAGAEGFDNFFYNETGLFGRKFLPDMYEVTKEASENRLRTEYGANWFADVDMIKKQSIEENGHGEKRKINTVEGAKKYASTQTLRPDGTYQVIRTKNGEIISGYRCNLNDITNTAEVYDRTAKAFVREAKESGSKVLGELLKKARV